MELSKPNSNEDFIFCNLDEKRIILTSDNFIVISDAYPVSVGHLLIVSKNHIENFFLLNEQERFELTDIINKSREIIEEKYKPDGFNIGINCGKVAGQTIMHFHCHLIPRYVGDVPNPRGGVRQIIPGKGNY
jgi:diadenosine tetraphosphate (Ap4A) HIT family hydrolase